MRGSGFLFRFVLAAATILALMSVASAVIKPKAKIPTSRAEVEKMKVKKLRQFLRERDVKCIACRSKDEFVNKVMESLELPIIAAPVDKIGESSDYEELEVHPKPEGKSVDRATRESVCPFDINDLGSPCNWDDECECMSGRPENDCKAWFPESMTEVHARCMKRMQAWCRRNAYSRKGCDLFTGAQMHEDL